MERAGVDRRPGIEIPVKKPIRAPRFAHLARSGPTKKSLLNSSSMAFAALIAMGIVYGFDAYFFDGYYASTAWQLFRQIGRAFYF